MSQLSLACLLLSAGVLCCLQTAPGQSAGSPRRPTDGASGSSALAAAPEGASPGNIFELAQRYRQATPPQIDKAIRLYLYLLTQTGHPEARLAQLELGNLVLDGKYSAGNDAHGRALNLQRARSITQELLGDEEYKIAIDYAVGRDDIPRDKALWLRFCKRAAAYNIDLAQRFYAEGVADGSVPDASGYDAVVWTALASDKWSESTAALQGKVPKLSVEQQRAAEAVYDSLLQTRLHDGAYYPANDPLREPGSDALASMPQDDPDVQIRTAFALEKRALGDESAYRRAMDLYRTIRDRREVDIRFILGRNLLTGADGLPKNPTEARVWLAIAAERGSQPAKALLAEPVGSSAAATVPVS